MRPAIQYAKQALGDVGIFVEVGVGHGKNAKKIYKDVSPSYLYLVDLWMPYKQSGETWTGYVNGYDIVKNQFDGVKDVLIIRKPSLEASKMFPDNSIDVVYIDANHQYKSVVEDIKVWFPKVMNGGFLCGHDYKYETVRNAVCNTLIGFEIFVFNNDDWLIKKEREGIL